MLKTDRGMHNKNVATAGQHSMRAQSSQNGTLSSACKQRPVSAAAGIRQQQGSIIGKAGHTHVHSSLSSQVEAQMLSVSVAFFTSTTSPTCGR